MLHHPLFIAIASFIGVSYIFGAYLLLQIRNAKPGYEDETGFHYLPEIETVVIFPDEERPSWLTGALAERFSGRPVEIFAASAA